MNQVLAMPSIETHCLTFGDVEDVRKFFVEETGMSPGLIQLSAGHIAIRIHSVDLSGVKLIWTQSQGRLRWQDTLLDDQCLHFGIAIKCDNAIKYRGHELDRFDAQVWLPNQQTDLIMNGPVVTLDINVSAALVDELGWEFRGEPVKQVNDDCARRLIETCERASLAGWRDGHLYIPSEPSEGAGRDATQWRERILDDLESILLPWRRDVPDGHPTYSTATRNYSVVRSVELLFENRDQLARLQIDELAKSLGVPRRSLFHAFRQTLGLSPREYFELKRLYAVRAELLNSSRRETTVSRVAEAHGFTELGRFAGIYRRRFSENPSATLKRST